MQSTSQQVSDALIAYVDIYGEHIVDQLSTQITSCRPLVQLTRTSAAVLCERVVAPLNTYWLFMAACVVLIVPCVVLAVRLRDLYRHTEPYTGIDYGLAAAATRRMAGASGASTPRHRPRFSAFITDTYDNTYRQRHKVSARE